MEIGSAWGQFGWLLQDAVRRGWRLGVCANSDEHRGRVAVVFLGLLFLVRGEVLRVFCQRSLKSRMLRVL